MYFLVTSSSRHLSYRTSATLKQLKCLFNTVTVMSTFRLISLSVMYFPHPFRQQKQLNEKNKMKTKSPTELYACTMNAVPAHICQPTSMRETVSNFCKGLVSIHSCYTISEPNTHVIITYT